MAELDTTITRGNREITGTVDGVCFERDGFVVARLRETADGRAAIVKGGYEGNRLEDDVTYRFLGRWQRHEKYGLQFSFFSFVEDRPVDPEYLSRYLSRNIPGIGPVTARKLIEKFGQDAAVVLMSQGHLVVQAGLLSEKEVKAAAETLIHFEGGNKSKIELHALLDGRGFPRTLPVACYAKWGPRAVSLIRQNPFVLLGNFSGAGFKRVDQLYKDLGLPLDAMDRQIYAGWNYVHSIQNGHTWVPMVDVISAIKEVVGTGAHPTNAIVEAEMRGLLRIEVHDGVKMAADGRRAYSEETICAMISRLLARGPAQWPNAKELLGLDQHQAENIQVALSSRVSLLVGYPGTGKTFCLAALVGALVRSGTDSVAVCAPTGKAAVRVREELATKQIFGVSVGTIHSLLGVERRQDGGIGFKHNETNPLSYHYIIVEEASMLDADLGASLFRACPKGAHVLLVGDPYQLPPVGHGAVLRDMIKAGIPKGELTEIRRNSGMIVEACRDVRLGKRFTFASAFGKPGSGNNLRMIEARTPEKITAIIREFLEHMSTAAVNYKFDPIDDIQVIVPLNRSSPVSKKPLNEMIQTVLNPHGHSVAGNRFRVGDKVICLRNAFQRSVEPPSGVKQPVDASKWEPVGPNSVLSQEVYVANGDIGRILAVAPTYAVGEFSSSRVVRIPVSPTDGGDDDDEGAYDLGYAVTFHKFQGSQAKCIVFVVDPSPRARFVGSRELVYTGLSRAEVLCLVVGDTSKLDVWRAKQSINVRRTRLRQKLVPRLQELRILTGVPTGDLQNPVKPFTIEFDDLDAPLPDGD